MMKEPKYERLSNIKYVDYLFGCIFKNPIIYFLILFVVTVLVLFLKPHAVVFKVTESSNYHAQIDEIFLDEDGFVYDVDEDKEFLDTSHDRPNPFFQPEMPENLFPEIGSESFNVPNSPQCSRFTDNEKFDCFPEEGVTKDKCINRGCCWSPVSLANSSLEQLKTKIKGVPFCYYPSDFKTYQSINISVTDFGATAYLKNVKNSSYPNNIQLLKVDFRYVAENILRIKIFDANHKRYESPFPKLSVTSRCSAKNTSYVVNINKETFGFNVIRKSNNRSIFSAGDVGGFIFADQFLQLSARLPSKHLYGLGQQRDDFKLDTNWRLITLFNHDREPADKTNLYGSHPFYMAMEEDGLSSGVFLHNTNAMDIILQPTPAITYRTIGGVLDFYFILGPSPADVIRQYTGLVGRPFMPPYWSLGFHLCRFGYKSLENTVATWNRTRAAGIPLDTQWNDIDYMEKWNDFTYDKVAFKGLPEFVNLLHKEGMHYVMMLDPGVSGGEPTGTYPPFDEGIKEDLFVKHPTKDIPFYTKVWNVKSTVFPDFFHPKTPSYWQRQIGQFHDVVPFDGLWIDMNDPSTTYSGGSEGCDPNSLDNPPYLPGVEGKKLCYRTLCMSARHYNYTHYDVHNIFASQEAMLTSNALRNLLKKRPFVISRSSYPGQGYYSGVWTGDIYSSWDDMAHSISDILSFSLFGIPMSGADICGFNGNTTVELCERWSQVGAFYPFSRNHNDIDSFDQDPVALGPKVVSAARTSLLVRYSLLPYLYTLFWHAHTRGDTVARPMFVEFPKDVKTYDIYSQFLWGSALLIAPQLNQDKLYSSAYLPSGRWYDFHTYQPIDSIGSKYLLNGSVSLLLRGMNIIPFQHPNTTTTLSRKNALGLIVSLCEMGKAKGDLYWDDGDTLDHEDGVYNYIQFTAGGNKLISEIQQWKYDTVLRLEEVSVLGVEESVTKVLMNGSPVTFSYQPDLKFLKVRNLTTDLSQTFTLLWS